MDWYEFAKNDWEVYQDASRIHKYVEYKKITADQYQTITDTIYE